MPYSTSPLSSFFQHCFNMRFSRNWLTLFTLTQVFSSSAGLHLAPNDVDSQLLASYDYIVAGGGASGLVIANRLSEDPHGE